MRRVAGVELSGLTRYMLLLLAAQALLLWIPMIVGYWGWGDKFVLYHSLRFLALDGANDSWNPMDLAWQYVNFGTPDGRPLYDVMFFDEFEPKFQYAPTSLLPIELQTELLPGNRVRYKLLEQSGWAAVWATALFSALAMERAISRWLPDLASGPALDRFARMGLVILFALTFYPLVKAFTLGQAQTWINGLFALSVWLWMIDRRAGCGVATGIACAIKPQLGLLLAWGVLARHWWFTIGLIVTGAIIGVASLALYGLSLHLEYLDVLSYISRRGEDFYPNNSVNGILNRLIDNGDPANWDGKSIAPYEPFVFVGTLLSSIALFSLALYVSVRPKGEPIIDFCIVSLLFTMASPVAWEHHYGVLLPMYAIAVPALLRWPVFGRWTMPYVAVSYLLCSNYFEFTRGLAAVPLLTPLQAYLFVGAVMLLVALFRLRFAMAAAMPNTAPEDVHAREKFRAIPLSDSGTV